MMFHNHGRALGYKSMKGRNLLVVTGGFPSVTQTFVINEVHSAMRQGWNVHVLAMSCGNENDWRQYEALADGSVGVTFLNWRRCPWLSFIPEWCNSRVGRAADRRRYGLSLSARRRSFFGRLLRIPEVRNASLIHAHFVEMACDIGVGLSDVLGIPLTVTAHDGTLASYSDEVLSNLQKKAVGIACVSKPYLTIWQSKTGSANKLHYVPNGVEVETIVRASRKMTETARIICVGGCLKHKRQEDFVSALGLLKQRGVDCRGILIGAGPHEPIVKGEIVKWGLEENIEVLGAQIQPNVIAQMNKADIFVLPSEWESFGIVMLEAMACGLPVVASRTAGASEVVVDGQTGFTFPIRDVKTMADQIQRLIENPNLRVQMGNAGRQRVETCFSWRQHMNEMNSLWKQSLHPRPDLGHPLSA